MTGGETLSVERAGEKGGGGESGARRAERVPAGASSRRRSGAPPMGIASANASYVRRGRGGREPFLVKGGEKGKVGGEAFCSGPVSRLGCSPLRVAQYSDGM